MNFFRLKELRKDIDLVFTNNKVKNLLSLSAVNNLDGKRVLIEKFSLNDYYYFYQTFKSKKYLDFKKKYQDLHIIQTFEKLEEYILNFLKKSQISDEVYKKFYKEDSEAIQLAVLENLVKKNPILKSVTLDKISNLEDKHIAKNKFYNYCEKKWKNAFDEIYNESANKSYDSFENSIIKNRTKQIYEKIKMEK